MIYLRPPLSSMEAIRVENPLVKSLIFGITNMKRIFEEKREGKFIISSLKYENVKKDIPKFKKYTEEGFATHMIKDILGSDRYLSYQLNCWEKIIDFYVSKKENKAILISAPTGFGKTEAFLLPLLQLLEFGKIKRIVLIYPRVALLQDQLKRILKYTYNIKSKNPKKKIFVGIWYEDVPSNRNDIPKNLCTRGRKFRIIDCWCSGEEESTPLWFQPFPNESNIQNYRLKCSNGHIIDNLFLAREDIVGRKPQIILTTLESFELLLLTPRYSWLIEESDAIVFDEIHQYSGIYGAHVSNILRHLIKKKIKRREKILLIGASATLENPSEFAKKIFSLKEDEIEVITPTQDDYETENYPYEHHFFILGNSNLPLFSTYIQTIMLFSHVFLKNILEKGKVLSFFDSRSVVNQITSQLKDAEIKRELWKLRLNDSTETLLNRFGELNWLYLRKKYGFKILERPIYINGFTSDFRPSSEDLKNLDVILSTSILELGIDIPQIVAITQFKLPWNYASFIQRKGRAGRRGTDSFIFLFLSDETVELNTFYRAERFLTSSFVIPLNPENKVVMWIHNTLTKCYEIAKEIEENKYSSFSTKISEFINKISEELDFKEFFRFLTNPAQDKTISKIIEDETDISPLTSEESVEELERKIEKFENEIENKYHDLLSFLRVTKNELEVQTIDTLQSYLVEKYKEACEKYLLKKRQSLEKALQQREVKIYLDIKDMTNEVKQLINEIDNLLKAVNNLETSKFQKEKLLSFHVKLMSLHGKILGFEDKFEREIRGFIIFNISELSEEGSKIEKIYADLSSLNEKKWLEDVTLLRKIYYLKLVINKLRKAFMEEYGFYINLKRVKMILQAMYYYWRYIYVFGTKEQKRNIPIEFWYVPDTYFGNVLRSFRIDMLDKEGKEYPLSDILFRFIPYKTEYTHEGKLITLKAKKPPLYDKEKNILLFSPDVEGSTVEGVKVPYTIGVNVFKDISNGRSVVRYCPKCYALLKGKKCPRHDEGKYGFVYSEPLIDARVKSVKEIEKFGNLSLIEGTFIVSVKEASVSFVPTIPKIIKMPDGSKKVEEWIKKNDQAKYLQVRLKPPLGMVLDTRGISIDVNEFMKLAMKDENLMEILKKCKKVDVNNKQLIKEIILHTLSHVFTLIVSNVAGVNPSRLFYFYDIDSGKIYVIESTIGGQGVVDLFFEYLTKNPRKIYEEFETTLINCQIESESLFSKLPKEKIIKLAQQKDWRLFKQYLKAAISEYNNLSDLFFKKLFDEFVFIFQKIENVSKKHNIGIESLLEIKKQFINLKSEGYGKADRKIVEAVSHVLGSNIPDTTLKEIVDSLFPVDYDSAVLTLHLPYCKAPKEMREILISYHVGKKYFSTIVCYKSPNDVIDEIFRKKYFPAGEINGKWVFISL